MEAMCIFYIIVGIICTVIGFVATIVCFACPIEHMWTVPLLLLGIFFIYMGCSKFVEIQVNEELNNNVVYENTTVEKCNCCN